MQLIEDKRIKDRERCKKWRENNKDKMQTYRSTPEYKAKHRENQNACRAADVNIARTKGREYNKKIKYEVLTRYSGIVGVPICAYPYCEIVDIDMLCVDHIDNNGNEHRRGIKKVGGGRAIYMWIKKNNFPSGFQVLCWNHNAKKGLGRIKKDACS